MSIVSSNIGLLIASLNVAQILHSSSRPHFAYAVRMKVIRYSDTRFTAQLAEVNAESGLFDAKIEQHTRTILEAVKKLGDGALLVFNEKFDSAKLTVEKPPYREAELINALPVADEPMCTVASKAEYNIVSFAEEFP